MKRKWTDEQLIEAVKRSVTNIGVIPAGGSYKVFHNATKRLNLNTNHFTGQGHLKGKTHNWSPSIPLEDILIDGSIPISQT